MPESMHERYDRDERRLVATAAEELWTDDLLDAITDVAAPILQASTWDGLPDDAPIRTSERYTASGALVAMALRASRIAALAIRAGYAAEALASIRRLIEAAGHAQRVADDHSGQYAENWIHGRGKADKPRVAFGDPEDDQMWRLMSGQAHAQFDVHAHLSATLQDKRLVHSVGPHRDPFWDSVWLWFVARHLTRTLAGLLKVHPHIDQADFLKTAARLVEAEERILAEIASRPKS